MKKSLVIILAIGILSCAAYYRMNNPGWSQADCIADDAFNRAKTGECRKAGYK